MSDQFKPGYFWQTVTTDPATGQSEPIDLSSAAIVHIVTPDQADVSLFWIQVQLNGVWAYVARMDGAPVDFRLMRSRSLPIPAEYTRPFESARIAVPASQVAYTFAVCVQPI